MAHLTQASTELFRRSPDERFETLDELALHLDTRRHLAAERWESRLEPVPLDGSSLGLATQDGSVLSLNDWSFGQLTRLCRMPKEAVNRLTPDTAAQVVRETLPTLGKPLQVYGSGSQVRSLHPASYTRLFDADLLHAVREAAVGFTPPPVGFNGATGLYSGEQDLFCFLIDDNGWTDIRGEQFAPGFFVWNSEVGRRSVGVTTFWFQAVCQNHIVWDVEEVSEFSRKHTANVHTALDEIRRRIERLAQRRDARRDAFASAVGHAMDASVGDAEDATKLLTKNGFGGKLAVEAVDLAERVGGLTVFGLVDALTRIAGGYAFAGDRNQLDAQAAGLLALAA